MTKIRANRIEEWCKKRGYSLKKLHDLLEEQGIPINYANLSSMKNHKRPLPKKYISGLAKALRIEPSQLFDQNYAGMNEEYTPWKAPTGHILAPLNTQDTTFTAQIYKNILDEEEIYPGDILIFDLSKAAFEKLCDRDIVMAQVFDDSNPGQTKTVIRQYIHPNLLITNSAMNKNSILHIQRDNAQIKAVLTDIYRSKK